MKNSKNQSLISPTARIGRNVNIAYCTRVYGSAIIEDDCDIGDHCVIGHPTTGKWTGKPVRIGRGAKIRSHAVIYEGSNIGDRLETGHYALIREENNVGNNLKIWSNSVIDFACNIGNDVKIHCNCYISQKTKVEDAVFLAPGVMVANEKFPTGTFSEERIKGAVIKKGAKIGINATILPGIVIGENSLIGAGSVVTKDIPNDVVAYGNPARVIRKILIEDK